MSASHIAASRSVLAACALALVLAAPGRVRADDREDARAYSDKATAAFALAKYAVAAEYFEKAFELRPDPALLYNAAQSHRLAGNKERALVLYRSYLRLYAKKENRAEIEARVDELARAIAHDKAVKDKPPNTTQPIAGGSPPEGAASTPVAPLDARTSEAAARDEPPPPAVSPRASLPAGPVLVAPPAGRPAESDSLLKKPWFWVATGGGVAVAVTVVLLLSMGGAKDPSPSFGRVNAN